MGKRSNCHFAWNGARSSTFYYLTASSRDYGFTTGTNRSKTIELTSLGRKVVYPENSEQEYDAFKQAFFNIDLFKQVYEYYKNGELPEKRYLYNTLQETFRIHADYHEDFNSVYSANFKYLSGKQSDGRHPVTSIASVDKDKVSIQSSTSNSAKKELFVIMPFSEKTNTYPEGYFYEKRGKIQRKYSPEFKKSVIMDMREHHLSYHETVRKYWNNKRLIFWKSCELK